jgi:hypothetical protein
MSKLFKLKNWLTIEEAARHLSGAFTESVTEADVLRLALDERLKLSVNFVNPVVVKLGTRVAKEDVPYEEVIGKNGKKYRTYISTQHVTDDGEIYIFDARDPDYTLRGICDIQMADGLRLEVERRFQSMTGGPKVTERPEYGVLIDTVEKEFCQFEMFLDESEIPDAVATGTFLMKQLAASPLSPAEQGDLIKKMLGVVRRTSEYCLVDRLPDEMVLVVRQNALTEFVRSVSATPVQSEKSLDKRKESAYLNTIAVLLELIQTPKPDRGTAAAVINEMVDNYKDAYGISKSRLEGTFASAIRNLKASLD